jgi:hypothetical protein
MHTKFQKGSLPLVCIVSLSSYALTRTNTKSYPVSASTSPIIVYKAPFTVCSNVFLAQEWSNLERDDVLRLLKSPPLGTFLVGWLNTETQGF